jgi:hypothetical protein
LILPVRPVHVPGKYRTHEKRGGALPDESHKII